MNGGRQLGAVSREGEGFEASDPKPCDGAGPEVGPVPLLEDLPALFGLVPLVPGGEDGGANDSNHGADPAGPRRPGRRPKPAQSTTVPFSVRFTPEERALVYRAALLRSPGQPVSAWARGALVGVAREVIEAGDDGSDGR